MENASKAILIAGSILIAILLITLGIRVFNAAADPSDSVESTMTAAQKALFNSKFTAYTGTRKTLAQVKALADVVIAHNATDKDHQVTFCGKSSAVDISNAAASFPVGSYTISISGYDSDGLVKAISIS